MKTIMDMALEAGFTERELIRAVDRLVAFAALIRADEREAERPWVGLTDEERDAIQAATLDLHGIPKFFATAIEAKLKERNT